MDDTPLEERLARIEAALSGLLAAVMPMVKAWERFGPTLEAKLNNPAMRWKARRDGTN